MKKNYILLVCLFLSFVVYGQQESVSGTPDFAKYMPTVTPSFPSPQAEAFQIFGQIPVSLYTGTPDISIPLYTLTEGDISVPITLSYHPAARKVNSLPSWVGLGWNLNVGGVITRIVRGSRDESNRRIGASYGVSNWISVNSDNDEADQNVSYPKGYMYNQDEWDKLEKQPHVIGNLVDGRMSDIPTDEIAADAAYKICYCCEHCSCVAAGQGNPNYGPFAFLDPLPDKFVFNFMGYSGSFWWDTEEGVFNVSSDANIGIEFDKDTDITTDLGNINNNWCGGDGQCEQHIIHFKLKTPDGFEYDFGGDANSFEYSKPISGKADDRVVSAWYLTKITSPKGYIVNFNYQREADIVNVYPHFEFISYEAAMFCEDAPPTSSTSTSTTKKEAAGQSISPAYLTNIESSLYKVEFVKSVTSAIGYTVPLAFAYAQNVDTNDTHYQLDEIRFFNHNNGNYDLFKSFDLTYVANSEERLKLLSLQEKGVINGNTDGSKGAYQFTYNGDKLPNPFSGSDHWGYTNDYSEIIVSNFNPIEYANYHNTKHSSTSFEHEILTAIKYPTGGHSHFDYEPHSYSYRFVIDTAGLHKENGVAGGVRIKAITNYDINGTMALRKEYYYTANINNLSGTSSGILSGLPYYVFRFDEGYDDGTTNPGDTLPPLIFDTITGGGGHTGINQHGYLGEYWVPKHSRTSLKPGEAKTVFNSGGLLPMGDATAGSHICYSNVIEVEKDANNAIIGYTTNRFTNYDEDLKGNRHLDDKPGYSTLIYSQVSCISASKNFERGKLILQEKYNSGKQIVESQRIDYFLYDDTSIDYDNWDFIPRLGFKGYDLIASVFTVNYGIYRPAKNTTTKYFYSDENQKDSIENVVEMTYFDNLISSTTSVLHSGDTLKTEISYFYNQRPLEVRQSINSKVQFGMIRVYDINDNNIIYPKYDYILESSLPIGNLPKYICTTVNSNFSKTFEYTANERGNIISAKNKAGVVTNFTWGYNNTRPMSSSTNGFNTFYEYQMPFGISKITAPDGTKTHFEYDGYGRLVSIKDDDLNPVEKYEYHYANSDENYNYLKKTVFTHPPMSSSGGEQSNVPMNQNLLKRLTFQYCDGLGREIQIVEKAASPLMNDIVQFKRYSSFATEDKIFLPFPKTNDESGEFMEFDDAYSQAKDYYTTNYNDTNFYSEIEYERSPLFRILKTGKPGSEYTLATGHTTKIKEGVGSATAGNKYHICHLKWAGNEIVKKANYNSQPYYKEITDPDGHILIQFFEKDGRILAERKILDNQNVTLYYVYDDMFRLRAVLQPDASNFAEEQGNNSTISLLAEKIRLFSYLYKYDNRGNIIEKKKPGLHDFPEYFAYDNMNRLISFRDGNLLNNNQFIEKEYDSLGRETQSYMSSMPTQHGPNYAPSVNGGTPPLEFDNSALQLSLTSNFYDGIFPADFPAELVYVADDYYGTIAASSKGQLTGTKVYMSDGNICEYTAMYYDKKGRLIQQRKTNFYAGNEDFYFRYNFVGELLETKHVVHSNDNFEGYTEKISNSIDHRGRLLSVSHQLNNSAPVLVAAYQYDELGKLKETRQFPSFAADSLRRLNYAYHIQGMLQKTQSPLFTETLIYGGNLPQSLSNFTASYNGNISAKQTIARLTPDATALSTMTETYKYDQLDRLTNAYHSGNNGSNFSVKNITYDLQGNILSLTRYGLTNNNLEVAAREYGIVNDIRNTPKGHVFEETQNENSLWPTYGSQTYLPNGTFDDNCFDHNGNTIYDDARETEFTYNHLNLATKITNPSDTMYIQYDAAGNKIRQISGVDTLYFVGGSIYKNRQLHYLPLPEGYYSDGHYFSVIHDYLGSVRMVIDVDSNKVEEVNHYDPWGVEYGLSSTPFGIQPFKHQGMEKLKVTGFSLHYHFARNADNLYGRWLTRDPLEEDYYWNGAYVYCNNNPIRYVDIDGMSSTSEEPPPDVVTELPPVQITATAPPKNNIFANGLATLYYGISSYGKSLNTAFGNSNASNLDNFISGIDFIAIMLTVWKMSSHISPEGSSSKATGKAKIDVKKLIKVGNKINRNGLTAVGRALQKHGSRPGSVFPKATGNPAVINAQGERILKSILENPAATQTVRHHASLGEILEVKISGGQGARFSADGTKFIGFLGPNE